MLHLGDVTSKIHFQLEGCLKAGGLNVAMDHIFEFLSPCFKTTVIYYFT